MSYSTSYYLRSFDIHPCNDTRICKAHTLTFLNSLVYALCYSSLQSLQRVQTAE